MNISRRCLSCGASVRANARFCPQCGVGVREPNEVMPEKVEDAANDASQAANEKNQDSSHHVVTYGTEIPLAAAPSTPKAAANTTARDSIVASDADDDARSIVVPRVPQQHHKTARNSSTPRTRRDSTRSLRPQVERHIEQLREASAQVFDEAAIDPSLRFVLIALALFAVFVVLLFANQIFKL